MNRLQKKCLVVSLAIHALLMTVLLLGSAFAPKRPSIPTNLPILDVIPSTLVDALISGGGKPGSPAPVVQKKEETQPTPAPKPPAPAPKPISKPPKATIKEPEPEEPVTVKKPAKKAELDEDAIEPNDTPRKPVRKRSIRD